MFQSRDVKSSKNIFLGTLLQMALLWESNLMSRNSDFTLNTLEMSRVASPNRCSLISHTKVSHKDLSGDGSTTPPPPIGVGIWCGR